jgi:hypothetical protein
LHRAIKTATATSHKHSDMSTDTGESRWGR